MGFFDNLGKKVTDAGQKTIQKTHELSEVARINSLISQNESKINNLYYQIGKLFVSIHGSDCGEEFSGMVSAVAELEQQSMEYRRLIQDIRGVRRCEQCGAEVSRESAFCSSCGAAMPKSENRAYTENYVKCVHCGTMVKKGMRFCTSCGRSMTQPTAVSTSSAAGETVEATEKICPRCGTRVAKEAAFCTECGQSMMRSTIAPVSSVAGETVEAAERICPRCGAKVVKEAAFCTECGAKL